MRSAFGIEHTVSKRAPSVIRALLKQGKMPRKFWDYGYVRASTQVYGNPKYTALRVGNAKQQARFRDDFAELKREFNAMTARRKPKKGRLRRV